MLTLFLCVTNLGNCLVYLSKYKIKGHYLRPFTAYSVLDQIAYMPQSLVQVAYKMHSQVLGCLAGVISSCSPFKDKFILFNKTFKNGIYIKAQVQIIQNIQIWLPTKNIMLKKKKR